MSSSPPPLPSSCRCSYNINSSRRVSCGAASLPGDCVVQLLGRRGGILSRQALTAAVVASCAEGAITIVGGGDSVAAVEQAGLGSKVRPPAAAMSRTAEFFPPPWAAAAATTAWRLLPSAASGA